MYNYALSLAEVKTLSFVPALQVVPTDRSIAAPQTTTVTITLPDGATLSQSVTIQVRNETPAIASLAGAVGDVVTLTFPLGGAVSQQVTLTGIADGVAKVSATGGGFIGGFGIFNVWTDPGSKLIGHWFAGLPSYADISGFRPAGTHDAIPVAGSLGDPTTVGFADDAPPGYTGQSLNLVAGNVAVIITNTASTDLGYVETFDQQVSNKFTIAFWAKGTPVGEDWNAWVSKRGEDDMGYQVRKTGTDVPLHPTFTIRGSAGGDDATASATLDTEVWHHFAATWDGTTGIRKLYVDGIPTLGETGDFGPLTMAPLNHLVFGGLDTGTYRRFFACELFDVRIYSYALDAANVNVLVTPPTAFSLTLAPLTIPTNEMVQLTVTLPANATATKAVTVLLTNNSPSVVKIVGSTGNVFPVIFPIGSSVQIVSLQTIGAGQINISGGAVGVGSDKLNTVNQVVAPKLIGHWLAGAANLTETSGFKPAGTHDGVAVGANPEMLVYSTDVPTGFVGKSLDLTSNGVAGITVGVAIANSALSDSAYQSTFDDGIASTFTVAFWAKGQPAGWAQFVSKNGEDTFGWELRRSGSAPEAFTVRGSASGNYDGVGSITIEGTQWHHYTGVWDGLTGIRKCYVDGILDPAIDLVGDYAPMGMAADFHLGLGVRDRGTAGYESWFAGKLCDVRIYNYPLSPAQVALLIPGFVTSTPTVTIKSWTGNQVRISWPTSFAGYSVQQSSTVSGGWAVSSLTVTVEGSENVVYAPTTTGTQFFQLKK